MRHSVGDLSNGGNPNFEKFKKELEKNFGVGETKRGERFSKIKGEPNLSR